MSDPLNDVVIVSALRTAITKANRGAFKDTLPDILLSTVYRAVLAETEINPADVQDICVGNALMPGGGAQYARVAQLNSGFPYTTCTHTSSRWCSSGIQACMNIADSIKMGHIDIGIGAGFEHLTLTSMAEIPKFDVSHETRRNDVALDTLLPMGITSENVSTKYGITRTKQDEFSTMSHKFAHSAQEKGFFDAEIVPVSTSVKLKDGKVQDVVVRKDEGIRSTTSVEDLAKLRAVFKKGGSTTAGNSSQVSDGAAAVLMMRRSEAIKRGYSTLGVIRSYAVQGCEPKLMGIGPAVAIPVALKRAGLTVEDIDIFEINEAFASQATYCMEHLGIPREKVNPKGGAIALGHPLGMTGCRQVATLLHELKRRGKRGYGVISMCIGTGMGAACVIEYEHTHAKL